MAQSRGLTWEEEDVTAGRLRLHYRRAVTPATGEAGTTEDGAPLLLLHGLGASGAVWQGFARRLGPLWAPIAPDLPGHGRSDRAPDGPAGYAPPALAADVVGLLDALHVVRAPAVGHSLGALVAFALAAGHPERVQAVVLLDPPIDPQRRNADIAEVFRLRHGPPGALEAYLAEGSSSPLAARALAPIYRQADDAVFESYLDAPPGAPWAWDAAPRVTVPVLVVQADPALDGVLSDAPAAAFVARLPQGRLLRLPGARHAVHASHPAEVAQALRDFLGSPPAA